MNNNNTERFINKYNNYKKFCEIFTSLLNIKISQCTLTNEFRLLCIKLTNHIIHPIVYWIEYYEDNKKITLKYRIDNNYKHNIRYLQVFKANPVILMAKRQL